MDFLTFASTAYGQTEGAAPKGPSMFEMLVMPVGFLVIMYLFIIKPQQKKAKEQADLLTTLKAGDEVVTTGGIIGKVRSVAESFVTLEVSSNTSMKVLKQHITMMTNPPAAAAKASAKS